MNHLIDYYGLLHVQPDAPEAIIKASYRAMMQKLRHHPDLGGDAAMAQLLNEAIETLCNATKRARYDRERLAAAEKARTPEQHTESGNTTAQSGTGDEPCGETDTRRQDNDESADGTDADTDQADTDGAAGRTDQSDSADSHSKSGGRKNRQTRPESENDTTTKAHSSYPQFPVKPHCPFCLCPRPADNQIKLAYDNGSRCLRCGGAATPLQALNDSRADELRRVYRHEYQSTVELWPRWPKDEAVHATLTDLSLAGCAIDSCVALSFDQIILLETQAINAICQVCYCKKTDAIDQYSIGLAFLTLHVKAAPGTVFSATA